MKLESINNKYLFTTFKAISVIIAFVIILQVVLSISISEEQQRQHKSELTSTIQSYQRDMSEKLSILSSSSIFIDFLRSGFLTRETKLLDMKILFNNLKDDTVAGVTVLENKGERIFDYGLESDIRLALKLCYLNDFLDSQFGSCQQEMIIHISKEKLIARLRTMNPKILVCEGCAATFQVSEKRFGSFDASYLGDTDLPIKISSEGIILHLLSLEVLFFFVALIVLYILHRSFRKISEDYIYSPLKGIVGALSTSQVIDLKKIFIFEIKYVAEALNTFISKTREEEELRRNASMGKVAAQLAHDIRSPLTVLKGLNQDFLYLPEGPRRRLQLCVNRIEEIAYNLLRSYKQNVMKPLDIRDDAQELLSLLENIVLEKRAEYFSVDSLEIRGLFDSHSYGLFSKIQRDALKRTISNLVNNGIESLEDKKGLITLKIYPCESWNVIEVSDNGQGIPEELRPKIFVNGFTSKETGNGLGLSGAHEIVTSVGGKIDFVSKSREGTTFKIFLPRVGAPLGFVSTIDAYKYDKIIVLDDDPAFHEIWLDKFALVDHKLEFFFSVKDLFSRYEKFIPNTLFLSDFEFMDEKLDGIDVILKYGSTLDTILTTARSEEVAVQERCLQAGIKLLPKNVVSYVRVNYKATPVILIDDDKLIRLDWQMYFQNEGVPFKSFNSINGFLAAASLVEKDSLIYIDSFLGDGTRGEVESEIIYRLGFENLFIATGFKQEDIKKPFWIKSVTSKNPRNLRGG